MATVNITKEVEVPEQLPRDIFVTAMYRGIDYWARTLEFEPGKDGENDFYAIVVDAEDWEHDPDDCVKFRIDHDSIVEGLSVTISHLETPLSARVLAALVDYDNADFDADDADNIVQMGLFADIVYG